MIYSAKSGLKHLNFLITPQINKEIIIVVKHTFALKNFVDSIRMEIGGEIYENDIKDYIREDCGDGEIVSIDINDRDE